MLNKLKKENVIKFMKEHVYLMFMFLSFYLIDFLLRNGTYDPNYVAPDDLTTNLFTIVWVIILIMILSELPKKIGIIIYGILSTLFTILCTAQYIYYSIFQKYFWLSDIVVAKEGADYTSYVISNFDLYMCYILFTGLGFMIISMIIWPKKKSRCNIFLGIKAGIICLCAFLLTVTLPNCLGEKTTFADWDSWRQKRYIYDTFSNQNKYVELTGIYSYTFRDIYSTFFKAKNDVELMHAELDEYYNDKEVSGDNVYTGLFKDKNVIFVMMESMDNYTISETYTPTITYMMENGMNFDQHHSAIFGTGATFNTEFTAMTGFHTPHVGNAAYAYNKNEYPYSLANLFKQAGYTTNTYHYNYGSYYNRANMHASIGFDNSHFFIDEGGSEAEGIYDSYLVTNDNIYEGLIADAPFMDFFITYSAHLPYDMSNPICESRSKEYPELWDYSVSEGENCINFNASETDNFFRLLLQRLYEDDLLEDTVIVAFTDHTIYGLSDKALTDQLNENMGDVINDRVPFFIYNYGTDLNLEVQKVTNSTDILPTVLNLFGMPKSKYYLGSDIFDDEYSGYVFFSDYSWYDGEIYYTQESALSDAYIQEMNQLVSTRIDINNKVLDSDYFKYLEKVNVNK